VAGVAGGASCWSVCFVIAQFDCNTAAGQESQMGVCSSLLGACCGAALWAAVLQQLQLSSPAAWQQVPAASCGANPQLRTPLCFHF